MIQSLNSANGIMRALILRRVALIEAGAGGPVLIGPESSPDVIRLQGFLSRNAYPHQILDPTEDRDAAELVKQYAPNPADLPLAVCPKGSILKIRARPNWRAHLEWYRLTNKTEPTTWQLSARARRPLDRGLCRL